MKERPILFSAPMVRALLAGQKTQTRRIVKWKPREEGLNIGFSGLSLGFYDTSDADSGYVLRSRDGNGCWNDRTWPAHSPYGAPRDHIWVRETFAIESNGNIDDATSYPPPFKDGRPTLWGEDPDSGRWWQQAHYRATDPQHELVAENDNGDEVVGRWKPSIFMPRWASRIQLEVTGVRVERLQAISEEDAVAEGVEPTTYESWTAYDPRTEGYPAFFVKPDAHDSIDLSTVRHHVKSTSAVENYRRLWDGINGARADWASNPWVWVVSFRLVQP